MKIDIEKLAKNKIIKYSLYVFLFLLAYLLLRKRVIESFDSDSSSSSNSDVIDIQDSETIGADLKTNATKIEDSLHLDKYRTQMENLIIDMNDWISAKTAQTLPAIAKKMNDSKDNIGEVMTMVEKMNELNKFKETLNTTMKYIDSK